MLPIVLFVVVRFSFVLEYSYFTITVIFYWEKLGKILLDSMGKSRFSCDYEDQMIVNYLVVRKDHELSTCIV